MAIDVRASQLIEVAVGSLEPGMFVAAIDRPWLETPFAMQGFHISSLEDIRYVSSHCSTVFIDPTRSQQTAQSLELNACLLNSEYQRAKFDFENAQKMMDRVFDQIRQSGVLDVPKIQSAVRPLVQSVLRHSDAMAALARLKAKDQYFVQHSLSCAVWSAVLGKHMAMRTTQLETLALGVALMDIGMSEVPQNVLHKQEALSKQDRCSIHNHIRAGLGMVAKTELSDAEVLDVIACHHERHDGSGYPQGLSGMEIPLNARIAGLVDTYDAMISKRPYSIPRSSFEAVNELADLKDAEFHGPLVEQFIQAVGVFPAGALVELNTGEVGVVVKQNPSRRLKPKIVVILDPEKTPRPELTTIDLRRYTLDTGIASVWITRELAHGAYGIEPSDYFI